MVIDNIDVANILGIIFFFIKANSWLKQKSPSSFSLPEGLHPVYLTLNMYCPVSVVRRVRPLPDALFAPFHLGQNYEFSMVSKQWQIGKAGLLAPPPF
jgi:hypothetical protein